MVTIRLSRGGAKGRPFYHIVVCDSRRARDGRYIDALGQSFRDFLRGELPGLEVDLAVAEHHAGADGAVVGFEANGGTFVGKDVVGEKPH